MLPRFYHVFVFVLIASAIISGCKSGTTEPNNTTTTHINIGDTVPTRGLNYYYLKSQLDAGNTIIPGTTIDRFTAIVDTIGLSINGKNNVFLIADEGDTGYYSYETNSDVSVYLQNPGYYLIANPPLGVDPVNQTLLSIENFVFHNWITLPIASKDIGIVVYSKVDTIYISNQLAPTDIHAIVDFIGDSLIILNKDTLIGKQCKISITANITLGTGKIKLTHERNIWFVPKIGYITKQIVRTNMPAIPVYNIPLDTTAILKSLYLIK
jgi:hypothetical protein